MSLNTATPATQATGGLNQTGPVPNDMPLLRVENISKQYPGTLALDNVSLEVKASEVHVLFGENGAGKSTLIQIVAGVHRPTAGKIYLNGKEEKMDSVHHARELGVSAVFQEFSIVPQLTVGENLFLGSEIEKGLFLNKAEQHRLATETLDRLGFPLKPNQPTMYLSRAEQQMVEIAKAFRTKPSIMILDEPTASLTERETNQLFALIETLTDEGIGIIYITHRMNEIMRIGDQITILRDGRYIDSLPIADTTEENLVELMTGRVVDQLFPEIKNNPGEVLLNMENICVGGGLVKNASINVRAGEVVGLAGLVGSGKSNIGRAAFGANDLVSGKITFVDEIVFDSENNIRDLSPRKMLDRGLYYLPSDRRGEGLVMMLSIRENVSLPSLQLSKFADRFFLKKKNEKAVVRDLAKQLDLTPLHIERDVEHFSGGNQQKALIARALARDVKLFIFDEPTVGVDVGARMLIYQCIRDLCEAGAGVLLISSDLPEILNLAHRSYVMYRGEQRAELTADETTEQNVLRYFFESEEA